MITKEYYLGVLRRLREAVQRKRPDMWRTKNFQLHHDNAPAHSAHVIQELLAKKSTPLVRQAPYSPDLAPRDFWLFPILKATLKGKRFQSSQDITQNRRRSSGAFQRSNSRGLSKSGRSAGKSVLIFKESILKEIK